MLVPRPVVLPVCAAILGGVLLLACPLPALAQSVFTHGVGAIAWSELTPAQKHALEPLSRQWSTLSDDQQRKWVALAANFNDLTPSEQGNLRSRMSEWVSMTPQERNQTRLNFGATRGIPADEKKAKWEEYVNLPPEERERLGSRRAAPPLSAAPAARPTPPPVQLRPPRKPPADSPR